MAGNQDAVEFPFLIGKVLTIYVGYTWMSDLSFLFLIGKVLTATYVRNHFHKLFLFLIGKVLTTAIKPLW